MSHSATDTGSIRQSCHCSHTRSTVLCWIPCASKKMTGFLSGFQIACYTITLYFQVIIIVDITVSDWVLFQLKILMCYITGQYCCSWKVLNHDITVNKREQSGLCYLTLTLCMASHNPTNMFSSSYWLSWWNSCSVVNGIIVASHSGGHIAVKCIDLFFEWHDSSLLCNSSSVCMCLLYLKSI